MNKLINNYNRGFSLKSDDLRFIDNSVRLAIADLCKALGVTTGAVILYGCNVTYAGTEATVTEGAIFYQDEIWHVSAHTFEVPDPIGDPSWCFVVSYDAAGAKLDLDLNAHQAYEVRTAYARRLALPFPAETVHFSEVTSIDNNYSTILLPLEPGVTEMGGNSFVIKTGYLAMLEIGIQANISSGTTVLIATVPEGLRPSRTIRGVCLIRASTATTKNIASWSINSAGQVYIEKLNDETGTWNIYFSTELFRIS